MKTCFSTEVVDLNNQAPNRNKRESKYFWDELNTWMSAAGFDNIEVPYEPKWDFGGRSGIPRTLRSINIKSGNVANYMKELAAVGINEIGVIHLNPSLFCQGVMEMYLGATGHYAEEAIQMAKEAGSEAVTLTVTPCIAAVRALMAGRADSVEAGDEMFLAATKELITGLAAKAKEAGVKLCLKNEYWGLLRGEAIVDFAKDIEGVCLDVDTANLQIAGVDVPKFIAENKDMIGLVHFTDTSFVDDQEAYLHGMPEFPAKAANKVFVDPGQGTVDFKAILAALKEAGYDGTIVYNSKDSFDIARAILRTRYFINTVVAE